MANHTRVREVELEDHVTSILDNDEEGFPLILIHAAAMDKSFWNHGVVDEITKSKDHLGCQRRIITYDLRGHGRAADAPITTSIEQLANDLKHLCNKLDLSKIDIGGISYGGVVAQQFTLSYPELVRSAMFIGTLSKGVAAFEERASMAEKQGMEALFEPTLDRWFLTKSLEANDAGVQYVRKQLEITKTSNWAAVWRALSKFDLTEQLCRVEAPALCLASQEDTSTPPQFLKTICGLVRNGRYLEIQGGMHLFPLEVPAKTAEAIVGFLDEVGKTTK